MHFGTSVPAGSGWAIFGSDSASAQTASTSNPTPGEQGVLTEICHLRQSAHGIHIEKQSTERSENLPSPQSWLLAKRLPTQFDVAIQKVIRSLMRRTGASDDPDACTFYGSTLGRVSAPKNGWGCRVHLRLPALVELLHLCPQLFLLSKKFTRIREHQFFGGGAIPREWFFIDLDRLDESP